MQYNTSKKSLKIPEYGRHVHEMIEYARNIEDRDQRNLFAEAIIEVMGNLSPHLRDIPDFKHKLWDQLFIMAEFDLDVDSPYEIPTAETFESRPHKVQYPEVNHKYRYYGNNVKRLIDYTTQLEDGEMKTGLMRVIGNQMKKNYLQYNKETVEDHVIWNHLKDMSNNKLQYNSEEAEFTLANTDTLKAVNASGKSNVTTLRTNKRGNKRRK
ncbi:MAG: DUF4290 domain-containing protein [Weeksellaceae bacterium]|nr:DUF4290 domain-containing protein [Weeksellaceae bacterium]